MTMIIERQSPFNYVWSQHGQSTRFVPKSERERARLIREARAIYDSIFPSADAVSEQQDNVPASHVVSGANTNRSAEVLLS
jgi:hypothetical protein